MSSHTTHAPFKTEQTLFPSLVLNLLSPVSPTSHTHKAAMERSFLSSSEDVLAHFGVNVETGLSAEQVLKSRQTYGSNSEWIPTAYFWSFTIIPMSLVTGTDELVEYQPFPKNLQLPYGNWFWNSSKIGSFSYSWVQRWSHLSSHCLMMGMTGRHSRIP